ncbi:MAG: peptide chain release factor 3, partial [Lachnospiraceae bacterium]|nr:peptide chain release factor 3 [Lachnospiraceae bacterium]
GVKSAAETDYDVNDPALKEEVGEELYSQLMDEIELLDGASDEFDQELVDKGELSPVFFGSALTTFGVETFLEHFLKMTQSPLPRISNEGLINPMDDSFSGFVFKIQANMNKAHHDRIAFMRICSGKFDASKEVYHVQSKRKLRLSQPQQIMAQDRKVIEEAYAGDVIGIFDPGIFSIGDTLCQPGKKFEYEGIPTFAPEHFCRLVPLDSMKKKQFMKGVTQIAQEGAIQIFKDYLLDMSEIIVGVVGVLQFDVLKYRLENEYGCDVRLEPLPYNYIRWVKDPTTDLNKLSRISDCKKVKDMKDNPLLLFANEWSIRIILEHNEGLELTDFRKN